MQVVIYMDILDRIKTLQRERGWSNYQLTKEAALTPTTLTNMFSRKTMPSIATLTAICEAFEISLSQFFCEDDATPILSKEEVAFIQRYRQLSKKNKGIVNTLINELE